MTTQAISGDFFNVAINGVDFDAQVESANYTHDHVSVPIMPNNVGVHQFRPGLFRPKLTINGFVKRGQGAQTAHNLLYKEADTSMITLIALGENAAPVAGNYCIGFVGTVLPEYTRSDEKAGIQKFTAPFQPRGVRIPPFPVLLVDASQAGTLTTTPYDDGTAGSATTNGGVSILEVITPTGVCAYGTISASGTISDADSFAIGIGGTTYTYTFKTALTPTAGEVLIGTTSTWLIGMQHLFQALVGDPSGSGSTYAAGTPSLPDSLITAAVPSAVAGITLTAVNSGTAANGYTLVKSGSNLAVSGGSLAGGVAGEFGTVVVQTSPTQGGAYTTIATHTLNLTARGAEVITVPNGTTIDRWIKVIVPPSAATQTWKARLAFGRWFPGQL